MFRLPNETKLYMFSFFSDPVLLAFSKTAKEYQALAKMTYQRKINQLFNIRYDTYIPKREYYLLCEQIRLISRHLALTAKSPESIEGVLIESMPFHQKYDVYHQAVMKMLAEKNYDAISQFFSTEDLLTQPNQSDDQVINEKIMLDKANLLIRLFSSCVFWDQNLLFKCLSKKDPAILDAPYQGHPLKSYLMLGALENNLPNWVKFFLKNKTAVSLKETDDSIIRKPLSYTVYYMLQNPSTELFKTKEIIELLLAAGADPDETSLLIGNQTLREYCQEQVQAVPEANKNILDILIQHSFEPQVKKRKI